MKASIRLWIMSFLAIYYVAGCSDPSSVGSAQERNTLTAEQQFKELIEKADAGDAKAQYEIGSHYLGGEGVPVDATKAAEWWLKSAQQGNPDAQTLLGLMYEEGNGVAKDPTQAVFWYRKAAEQGDAMAQYHLGRSYLQGNGISKDVAQAVTWYRKAAEQGYAEAQLQLGWMYDDGEGIPKDAVKAFEWYRKAAEQGNPQAQFNLGVSYASGEGVPLDHINAAEWYRKSAEQGYSAAQNNLGSMYDGGMGVPKDAVKAVEWYRKAAEQGEPEAQRNLAVNFWKGQGVHQDRVLAYMWINLAAAQGHVKAIKNRAMMENLMTPEQIAEAQRMTREWKPGQHAEPSAAASGAPAGAPAKALTGTAFVVSEQGHLLTNRHVVIACAQVRLAGSDKPLKLLPQDAANDLALLQMPEKPQSVALFRNVNDLRQGESIAVYGYPLEGSLAAGGNLAPGVVSALAGLGNNTSQIQITAPVQPGNSGGPVLDRKGQVVGVVVQKLDAVKVAKLTGDVPQNVNFAVNEATARAFLDSNQVPYTTGHWWQLFGKSLEDTAAEARKYTVVVECWK